MYARLKRCIDFAGAIAIALVLSPFLLIIAIVIALDCGFPVLFRQERIGLKGRPFTVLKFRTMHPGAHTATNPQAHATRSGRVLRRWGIDELPQLWNVIRGDMSLVGPRPTLPEQVARYGSFEHQRHDVRPGLTGLAQVNGRNALSWPERIRLDIHYARHASLLLDMTILMRTCAVLLSGKGTYGLNGVNPDFLPDS